MLAGADSIGKARLVLINLLNATHSNETHKRDSQNIPRNCPFNLLNSKLIDEVCANMNWLDWQHSACLDQFAEPSQMRLT